MPTQIGIIHDITQKNHRKQFPRLLKTRIAQPIKELLFPFAQDWKYSQGPYFYSMKSVKNKPQKQQLNYPAYA